MNISHNSEAVARRFLSLFFIVVALLSYADEVWVDSATGYAWSYMGNENNTLTITGLSPAEGDAEIPGEIEKRSVANIDDHAFYSCESLTSIAIPNGVTSIGSSAFRFCAGLTNIVIGSGVTNIGPYAFSHCVGLTNIVIGSGVTSIGSYAFSNCRSLTSVTIGNSVTSIGEDAFIACAEGDVLTVRMLGNAPTNCDSWAFERAYGDYEWPIIYVMYGTTGWDGNSSSAALPAKWNNCDIKYAFEVRSFRGVYDGYPHGITIDWGDYIPNEARVMYASNKDGPYAETPITYIDIGEYVVWSVVEESGCAWTNSATVTILGNVARLEKTLVPDSFVYDGTAHEPTVVLKDLNALPNLNVTAYAPGDVDGDGVLSQNDVVLIQRHNAYQALSDAMKEKFPSYNLTGAALAAADVNQDGIVNADDVTTLNGKFSGYELVEGSDYTLAYSDNVNAGTGKVTITGKGNYGGTAILEFTIAKATIGADGEPGSGTVPDGGISKFDASFVYDGEGYTINTNALVAAFGSAMVGAGVVEYAVDDGTGESPVLPWLETAPVYTNAGEYVVWYRVTNPNYEDFVHAAKLSITKRPVTVTVVGHTATYGYDMTKKTVAGYDIATEDALYDIASGTLFRGGVIDAALPVVNRIDVGTTAMGLAAADFSNSNANFLVTYLVTDGRLSITMIDEASVKLALGVGNVPTTAEITWYATNSCVSSTSHDGVAALRSRKFGGRIFEFEVLSATISGPKRVTFYWQCCYDDGEGQCGAELRVDGIFKAGTSTYWGEEPSFGFVDIVLGAGQHTLTWTCGRNGPPVMDEWAELFIDELTIEDPTFGIDDGTGGTGGEASRFSYSGVYDGVGHGISVEVANAPSGMTVKYARGNAGTPPSDGWSAVNPLFTNVCDRAVVWYAVECAGYVAYTNSATVTIMPKTLTDEMVVLTDEAFFYDPGSTVKKPSVTVSDTNAVGVVISTVDDYTVVYDEATSAGAVPVTVTGKNNYTGKVTKTFDVLKRPVAPPVIGSKSYNGRTQRATVTADERWTVVENDGGINVGEYPVVLQLVNPNDYMWKGADGGSSAWTGVFEIRKANNGWSRYPGILGWSIDEEPNDPTGQSRYGTLSVAYRKAGTEVATETLVKPSEPGDYIARFWVEGTENYIGVALTVHYEVAFTITASDGIPSEETQTTPVPVPYTWLEKYVNTFGGGDFEKAANSKGANGVSLWESYVAGLDPDDAMSRFTAKIEMGADGKAVVTWTPDMSKAEKPRKYTTLGKEKLGDDAWSPVTNDNKAKMRFFKVTVEMK